jgi:hypothetical protein
MCLPFLYKERSFHPQDINSKILNLRVDIEWLDSITPFEEREEEIAVNYRECKQILSGKRI